MAKTDEYGKLLQAKQNRKAELDRAVDDWLTNMYTQYMLEQAQEYYERVRQPVVIRQAGEYLNLMTQGRYTLQASLDGKQLFAVDGSQRRVPENSGAAAWATRFTWPSASVWPWPSPNKSSRCRSSSTTS